MTKQLTEQTKLEKDLYYYANTPLKCMILTIELLRLIGNKFPLIKSGDLEQLLLDRCAEFIDEIDNDDDMRIYMLQKDILGRKVLSIISENKLIVLLKN